MEQTPLPPLVSDQRIRDIETGKFASERMYEMNYRQGMHDMRDIYEADRQKTREVVQELVDDLSRAYCIDKPSLDLAKLILNIEPTKP
jgi:ABC-type microcin C transport system permease subunit YejB